MQAAQEKTEPGCFKRNPGLRPYGRAGPAKMAVSKRQAQTDKVTVELHPNRLGTYNVSINLGNTVVSALLDTGASDNFIAASVFSKLSKHTVIKSRHIDEVATLANGSQFRLKKKVLL